MLSARLRALALSAFAVIVSACGAGTASAPAGYGPPATTGAPPAAVQRRLPRDVVYVSDYVNEEVLAFPASTRAKNPAPLLTIALGTHPNGLWVDRDGILYVAAYSSVLEFKPGLTTPFRTITDGVTGAEGVTVDKRGTLYVVNHAGADVTVVEYRHGGGAPSQTLTMTEPDSLFGFPGGATFDAAGNLYVSTLFYPETNGHVFRFAPGATTGTDLGLADVGSQDGLAFDAQGNLYVGDLGPVAVYRPGATQPFETIGKSSDYPSFFAVSAKGFVYAPYAAGVPSKSRLLEYTSEGKQVDAIGGTYVSGPTGVALRSSAF